MVSPTHSVVCFHGYALQEEFCSGVLRLVASKLEADMREIVLHDQLMAHLVDELLFFEKELRLTLPSMQWTSSLSLVAVLLDPVPFDKWRTLEKACESLHVL